MSPILPTKGLSYSAPEAFPIGGVDSPDVDFVSERASDAFPFGELGVGVVDDEEVTSIGGNSIGWGVTGASFVGDCDGASSCPVEDSSAFVALESSEGRDGFGVDEVASSTARRGKPSRSPALYLRIHSDSSPVSARFPRDCLL